MQIYSMIDAEAKLLDKILNRKDIFKTLYVIVPNKNVGSSFKEYFLNNSSSVLMNVKFITFDMFLKELIRDNDKNILSEEIYKLLIVDSLINDEITDNKIKEYLNKDNLDYQKKLYDLTNTFYSLFVDYEEELFTPSGYENELFRSIMHKALINGMCMKSDLLKDDISFADLGEIYFLGFLKYKPLEQKIKDKYKLINNVVEFNIGKKKEYNKMDSITNPIINAVTKDKEIEVLHSKICRILNDGAKYSDILVVAPNINSYEAKIKQVFEQDGINYPKIKYNILSNGDKLSDTFVVLDVLARSIRNEFTFSRYDFSLLLNTNIIKEKYMMNQFDVNDFIRIILKLNVYNNLDFDYLKKRLILSLVSDTNDDINKVVQVDGKQYYPYKEIFLDNDNILKVVKIIESVENYINLIKNIKNVSGVEAYQILESINNLVSIDGVINKEINKINNYVYYYNMLGINMPIRTFMDFIYDLIRYKKCNNFDTSGVTFRSFSADYITPAKYTFFIGCSSNDIPIKKVKQELDLRDNRYLDTIIEDEINAFTLLYQNSENFYTSYVSKNLKAEEDFFISKFTKEIYNTLLDNNGEEYLKEEKYGLDENRCVEELYTKREFKNKGYITNNINHDNPKCDFKDAKLKENDIRLTTKDIESFLIEPFSARALKIFPRESEEQEKLNEEYEQISIDNIVNSTIVSELAKIIIQNNLSSDDYDDERIEKVKEKYKLEKKIPYKTNELFDAIFKTEYDKAIKIKDFIARYNLDGVITKLEPLTLKNEDVLWTLECNNEFIKIVCNNSLIYAELKEIKKNITIKDYMHLYALSLADIASVREDREYDIKLLKQEKFNYSYKISPSGARCILNKIYNAIEDYKDTFFFDVADVDNEDDKIKGETFAEYFDSKTTNGPWTYFKSKKMFDIEDLGYDNDLVFKEEIKKNKDKMKELIIIQKE